MTEAQWVELIADKLRQSSIGNFNIRTKFRLAYGHEITSYGEQPHSNTIGFETDLVILETTANDRWKPRVVVEAKVGRVTTHDAIVYSQKASSHRAVHPYLRYGIILGNRRHHPLPGRLYRHGVQFEFMMSFVAFEPSNDETHSFIDLLQSEIEASRTLERILYDSRRRDRDRYTMLHRKLIVS